MKQYKHKRWGDIVTVEDGKVIDMPARFLADEWEEYEDSKTTVEIVGPITEDDDTVLMSFDTHKEAVLASEKLKAWKRLKDKGFRFCGHDDRDRGQLGDIVIYAEMPTFEYDDDSTRDDLDLLFGGEE